MLNEALKANTTLTELNLECYGHVCVEYMKNCFLRVIQTVNAITHIIKKRLGIPIPNPFPIRNENL